jgi:hypothetical protein
MAVLDGANGDQLSGLPMTGWWIRRSSGFRLLDTDESDGG